MRFLTRWPLTLLLALLTIVLSFAGYYFWQPAALWPGPLEWLMKTIALFKMSWSWSGKDPAPWPLHIAQFTGAFFTLSALGKVWMKFFGDQIARFRLSRWRGHVVICGLGRKGQELALEFRRQKKRVVVAETCLDEDNAETCRRAGIFIETGDATKEVTLETVSVERAALVFAVCRDDHTNLEIGMATLARFAAAREPGSLQCYVHLVNLPLRVLLQRHELLKVRPKDFELHFFNIYENAARIVFTRHPPEAGAELQHRVHLVVVGLTPLGEAVATQAARIGHYADLQPVRVTMVDEQAEARAEQFLTRQPGMEEASELRFLSLRLTDPRFTRLEFLDGTQETERITVVLCLEEDETNIELALTLAERTAGRLPLLANVSERHGLAKLLDASESELSRKGIHRFGAVEEVCSWHLVREEELDIIAKGFAKLYQERHGGAGWADLNEDLRNSNRAAADHIDVKLRAIHCRRVPISDPAAPAERFVFSTEELELLARMEHRRWAADRRLNGWVCGATRDNELKVHPQLISWDELSEGERKKDRDQVRDIPQVLALTGHTIQRAE